MDTNNKDFGDYVFEKVGKDCDAVEALTELELLEFWCDYNELLGEIESEKFAGYWIDKQRL